MKSKSQPKSEEFSRFEDAVRKIVSVPKKEILEREKQAKAKQRKKQLVSS